MQCIICDKKMRYYFSKVYNEEPYASFMKDIGEVEYYKCPNCGFVLSKTHKELSQQTWEKLNSDFHHYNESIYLGSRVPYVQQAALVKILLENQIIESGKILDYAGGFGRLSKTLKKYFQINNKRNINKKFQTNKNQNKELTCIVNLFLSSL